jgi:choline kinase
LLLEFPVKQAVILAAGRGVRLGNCGGDLPKCLLDVGGRSLLELQIEVLHGIGIHSICVVAGHEEQQVRRTVAGLPGVTVLTNPVYATTNSLYSLWLTRSRIEGPFICINGDLIAHPDVFHRVLAVEGCALAYDSGSGQEEEHMKIQMDGRYLRRIGKDLSAPSTHGENVGILQFSAAGATRLFAEATGAINAGEQMAWAPAVLNRFAPFMPVRCVDVRGLPWVEVDFPRDLVHAREVVWPAIQRHAHALAPAAARGAI